MARLGENRMAGCDACGRRLCRICSDNIKDKDKDKESPRSYSQLAQTMEWPTAAIEKAFAAASHISKIDSHFPPGSHDFYALRQLTTNN
jgi:hypothetical protein